MFMATVLINPIRTKIVTYVYRFSIRHCKPQVPKIPKFVETHIFARACVRPCRRSSNNPQFGRGSRNARALISPGVFSSTGSHPWSPRSTIRLVRYRGGRGGVKGGRREFRFLRKPLVASAHGCETRCRTLCEYKPGMRQGCRGGAVAVMVLSTRYSDPSRQQPSNPTRPSLLAIHQRRECMVFEALLRSPQSSLSPTATAVSAAADLRCLLDGISTRHRVRPRTPRARVR